MISLRNMTAVSYTHLLGRQRNNHREQFLEARDQKTVERSAQRTDQQAGRQGEDQRRQADQTSCSQGVVGHAQHNHAQRRRSADGDIHIRCV